MALTHWYYLLLPVVVFAVMSLLRFRGCSFDPSLSYGYVVNADGPIAWFKLQESPGATTAANAAGSPDGTYGTAPSPLSAGNAPWHSPAVASTSLTLGVNNPSLVPSDPNDPDDFSIAVAGAFVQLPPDATSLQNLTEFTLECLLYPTWDLTALGNYYCVMELAARTATLKNQGFGLYAGPMDPANPTTSPYWWQLWMGNGTSFQLQPTVLPLPTDPGNPNPNPGPTVEQNQVTYVAVTYSQSQGQAFLYLYNFDRDIDYVAYPLLFSSYSPVTSAANTQGMRIGIAAEGPLFAPPAGAVPPLLYPFIGQMCNVAIYNKVLTQDTLRHHATVAFYNTPA
jgi:hypothetical protein